MKDRTRNILLTVFSLVLFQAMGQTIHPGAYQTGQYLDSLEGKRIACVVNQTSVIGPTHLVDSLLSRDVNVKTIFAPEHGFRGKADAGEQVLDGIDSKTGLPIISLYGSNKKPTAAQLEGIDLVIFDIQDVGVRFYTYISTLHYVMEACAEQEIKLIVLDRPNPHGNCVAGPVRDDKWVSFVGLDPIPVIYGMTMGELAQMINGELWLKNTIQCKLQVIPCSGYDHNSQYSLPVKPSPNLPNDLSIKLYPSLCLFEATEVSVGRGTLIPFTMLGTTYDQPNNDHSFTPISIPGMSKGPKHEGKQLSGHLLTATSIKNGFDISWLLRYYNNSPNKEAFFTSSNFFNKLAGNSELQQQIKQGMSQEEIEFSWQDDLKKFKSKRSTYLLYKDFE